MPLWWSGRRYWIALALHLAVLLPTAVVLIRLFARLRGAMDVMPTWAEGQSAGVRWGWNPRERSRVFGPYCPNPGHGSLLYIQGENRTLADADVISNETPMQCPMDPSERFDFRSVPAEPLSVGVVRDRVREALDRGDAWKTAG